MRSVLLGLALLAGGAAAQTAPRESALARVVVIGASGSVGLGVDRSLADALRATFPAIGEPLRDEATSLLFLDPLGKGAREIEAARAAKPTLVVAVDFLFWFAYGMLDIEGKPIAAEEERLPLLDRGLELLAGFACPVVVGDLPDCSRAIGKMLLAEQVPAPATLVKLNARIQDWAKSRPNVVVVPLAESVRRLFAERPKTNELDFDGWKYPSQLAAERLFQDDELHPTVEGLALIAHFAARGLVERELVNPEEVVLERAAVLERLRGEREKR